MVIDVRRGPLGIKPESQATIVAWADETFGVVRDPLRVATHVHEVLLEFSSAIQAGKSEDEQREFAADVAICLYRLAGTFRADLDRRVSAAMMMGQPKELVPESDSTIRAVLRAETKLILARNMIADEMPVTRILPEITAVRVILEEVVSRLGGDLTDEVDSKMASHRTRAWLFDAGDQDFAEPQFCRN